MTILCTVLTVLLFAFALPALMLAAIIGIRRAAAFTRAMMRRHLVDNPHVQLIGEHIARVETDRKIIALTFDDGPYSPYTEQLLDLLSEMKTPATFFLVGEHIERYRQCAERIVQEGHQVGNHSYSHPRFFGVPFRKIREEVERTDTLIRSIGYRHPISFRAPYGIKFVRLPLMLYWLKKRHVLFDVWPEPSDCLGAPVESVVGSIAEKVSPGSIIVLHDGNTFAAPNVCQYARLLVARLRDEGYSFVTVDQLIAQRKIAV